MTLSEAIKHCEEVADYKDHDAELWNFMSAEFWNNDVPYAIDKAKECRRCAVEHRQLAEWLKELKWWKSLPHYCMTCKHGAIGEYSSSCISCHGNSNWKCGYKGGEGE